MKKVFAIVFLMLAGITFGCRKSTAGPSGQQVQTQAPDMADHAEVADPFAAAAALRFLDRLEHELAREAPFVDPMQNFSEEVVRQADEQNMVFSLDFTSSSKDRFLIKVDVSRASGDVSAPGTVFPGLDLRVDVTLNAQSREQDKYIRDIIERSLWVMRMAEPSVGGRICHMLEPMIADIHSEIQALAAQYPVLAGFERDARTAADLDEMTFGVFYERDMGQSTRKDPNGALLGPDSFYISFRVSEYIPMMNRWVGGSESRHVDVPLENMNLEVSWNMETHDEELPDIIYTQIIRPRIEMLQELDAQLGE